MSFSHFSSHPAAYFTGLEDTLLSNREEEIMPSFPTAHFLFHDTDLGICIPARFYFI